MKQIIVGSTNPVKINAVKEAFTLVFPDQQFQVEGYKAASGVSDQPMEDEETITGARNRATACKEAYPDAEYWVGMEGGCGRMDGKMSVFAWMVVMDKERTGEARSGMYFLPQKVVDLIDQGMELGDADNAVFGQTNSKQESGSVGIMTGDVIDRTAYYVHTLVLALVPFRNKELY